MKDPNKKNQINFSVENHYIEKIKKHAKIDGRTMSNFLRAIVVQKIERLEKEQRKEQRENK